MSLSDYTTDYAKSVVGGQQPACRFVKLACQRHLDDLERDWDYHFDVEAANKFFRFCKYLKHYKGEKRGEVFDLEPWQMFIYGSIYGWLDKSGNWRFKTAYIEVPRKNGKTTMSGAGACYDSAIAAKSGSEVYCVATKEAQAKLLFNDCLAYVNQSEELKAIYSCVLNSLFVNGTARTSFIKPLGSDSHRLDGLNPLAVYADELHAWTKRSLWDVMEDAFGARKQYHMIAITTAGYDRHGICWEERNHLVRILERQIEADNKFGIIYTVDEDKQGDWDDPEVWAMANPNLGVGKELEYMKQQVEKVKQVPSKLNTFLNKQLNIWTDVEQAWIATDDWNSCASQITERDLLGKYCYGGMDLARVNDLSACAYYFPAQEGLENNTVLVDFFIPNANLRERIDRDRVPYDLWSESDALTLTEGNTTDWDFIKHSIMERNGQFDIREFGYDRHFAGELVSSLEKDGREMKGFGMGFLSMASPTAEFERQVVGREIRHLNSPILNWNVANTIVVADPAGNLKPDKARSIDRIDGTVAVLIALGMHLNQKADKKPKPYKERGLRML